jgi:DhnA family fructose-bisphosphate aldolase class Ia
MTGKSIRLHKLFSNDGNAVIIAMDHGMFDGPIPGMTDLRETVEKINPAVDGILLSPGMLKACKDAFSYKGAPLPIVRINWGSVYCFHWQYNRAATVVAAGVKEAVALGAEIVLVSLTVGTGDEERDARNVEVYCRLKNQAESLGIPVLGEYFPASTDTLGAEKLHELVLSGSRILSELGTDMIKTFYTMDFKKVTDACPVPVLGLGAEKTPTQLDALTLASNEIRDGARGVVFGRNAIQVPDPFAFQAALCKVVKEGAAPAEVVNEFNLG